MICFRCNNCKNNINFHDIKSKRIIEDDNKFYIIEDIEDGRRISLLCNSCKSNFKIIYWFGNKISNVYKSSLKITK